MVEERSHDLSQLDRKSFPMDSFTSEARDAVELMLFDWERTDGHEMEYALKVQRDDRSWQLSVDPKSHKVIFTEEDPTLVSPAIRMRNVKSVHVYENDGVIDFLNHRGMIYRIAGRGFTHLLISPDGDASASLDI